MLACDIECVLCQKASRDPCVCPDFEVSVSSRVILGALCVDCFLEVHVLTIDVSYSRVASADKRGVAIVGP